MKRISLTSKWLKVPATVATLCLATFGAASTSFAVCHGPVGGSEHSVGIDWYSGQAMAAYSDAVEVKGQEQLLTRQGYCPTTTTSANLLSNECSDSYCTYSYSVSRVWSRSAAGNKVVAARVTWTQSDDGTIQHRFVSTESLDLTGLGTAVVLNEADSDTVMDALGANGGVNPTPGLMGVWNVVASRILCSAAVVPHPVPHCTVMAGDDSVEASASDSAALMALFVRAGALVGPAHIVGATNRGGALVECSKVVVPHAHAGCSFVIEVIR